MTVLASLSEAVCSTPLWWWCNTHRKYSHSYRITRPGAYYTLMFVHARGYFKDMEEQAQRQDAKVMTMCWHHYNKEAAGYATLSKDTAGISGSEKLAIDRARQRFRGHHPCRFCLVVCCCSLCLSACL